MRRDGWFIWEDQVSYCLIDDEDDDNYFVTWQGQPIGIAKDHCFNTMLGAQMHSHSHLVAKDIEDHKQALMFFDAHAKKCEEDAAILTEHRWPKKVYFLNWGFLGNTEYKVKYLEWKPLNMKEVQILINDKEWMPVDRDLMFRTPEGAYFHGECTNLNKRIHQEEQLYKVLQWMENKSEKSETLEGVKDAVTTG
ncbi:MAG: hypothetical protein ACW99G_19305 [Candidatus Thorarchaeota archaeon]|jgi:hypothetical protein